MSFRTLLTVSAAACLIGCTPAESTHVEASCHNRTSAEIGGPISLISETGAPVTEADFKGHQTLLFFGFTHCPDICPATMYLTGQAMSLLPAGVETPMTLFISVDPERDTPEMIARYIASNGFPKKIMGLTGTVEQISQVSDAFLAPFERVDDETTASGYSVNHSALLYLMDKDWKLATFFSPDQSATSIASCIASLS